MRKCSVTSGLSHVESYDTAEAIAGHFTAPADPDDNVSFAEELVEIFLADYTQPGDLVFDPFAGFGTTLSSSQSAWADARWVSNSSGRPRSSHA